jgi:glycogen(starch) synthase
MLLDRIFFVRYAECTAMNAPVFMIGWEFPPHNSGGLGVACQGLTRGLHSIGQPVVFALPQVLPGGGSYRKIRHSLGNTSSEMEMILVNSQLEPYWQSTMVGQHDVHDMVSESKRYGQVVTEIAAEYKQAPLLHAHDWMSIPAGIQAKQTTGKPLVLHIHSTEFDRSGGGEPNSEIADVEWQGLTAADKIVAVSQYTKQLIMEKYGIAGDKIEVVHNGIDPNPEYHAQPLQQFLANKPVILFVGRLTIQKGPEYFLAVAKRVIAHNPQAVFVLAGQGDMYQSLLVSSAYQGLSSSVLFAGFLRGKEKEILYQRADVFVMPSVSEPFGIAALEAALAKTPVIVSKNSGVTEVLPHAHAIDFWDIEKMTRTILELLEASPARRRQQGQLIQQEALALEWKSVAQKIQRIYDELIGQ